ncbi:MAG TPA: single-stranded DNA-binding protein [Sandaracinaceae bacterium LLY-WYZ-13_1]|nr:single-stranded DNA-binding protein [Sandaracinaceae bacterium LLY-WYZ-13_1]
MNKIVLVGRVDSDAHFKITPKGKRRLWFRVCCVSESYDETGRTREHQTWLSVVCWGGRAEGLRGSLPRGQWVAVEGRIGHWKRDGEHPPRWETEVVASEITRLADRGPVSALRPPGAGHEAA